MGSFEKAGIFLGSFGLILWFIILAAICYGIYLVIMAVISAIKPTQPPVRRT